MERNQGKPLDPSAGVLDEAMLSEIRSLGPPGLLAKVLRTYLQSAPKLLNGIRTAVAEVDPVGLRSAAHTLKSSSGAVGATAIADLARRLEETGRSGSTQGADSLAAQLDASWIELEPELRELVRKETP